MASHIQTRLRRSLDIGSASEMRSSLHSYIGFQATPPQLCCSLETMLQADPSTGIQLSSSDHCPFLVPRIRRNSDKELQRRACSCASAYEVEIVHFAHLKRLK